MCGRHLQRAWRGLQAEAQRKGVYVSVLNFQPAVVFFILQYTLVSKDQVSPKFMAQYYQLTDWYIYYCLKLKLQIYFLIITLFFEIPFC